MEEIKTQSFHVDEPPIPAFCTKKTDGIVLGYFVLNRKTDEIIHTEINENGIPVVYFEFSPSISLPEYKGWEFFMTENDFRYVARFALVKSDEPHS